MEPWRGARAPALRRTLLLLLLLLLLPPRPVGCADEAPGALSSAAAADPGAPGGRRPLQQAAPTPLPTLTPLPTVTPLPTLTPLPTVTPLPTQQSKSPTSPVHTNLLPICGMSRELDPTLRDEEAMVRRWPWLVSVQANGTYICAGTLISSQWVLTVAHCVTHSPRHGVTYSVRVGSPWTDQTAQTSSDVPVQRVIINSRFRSQRLWSWVGRANDIALLWLAQAVRYSQHVWPICLPGWDYVLKDNSVCTVTGWGLPKVKGKSPQSRTIQEKDVTIQNSKACDRVYRKFSRIPSVIRIVNSQMICAQDVDREQFCSEISGEPLTCLVESTWYLVGMLSWAPGCKDDKVPPIYLRISSYQHWIWKRINGQAVPAPSRALLLALPLPLSLLAAR